MSPGFVYAPDLEAIRGHVQALSGLRRSSARPGEWESAAWLVNRLHGLGLPGAEIQRYRYQRSYALAHALHNLSGLAACARGGVPGAALAAATLVSFEREVSGRSQWLRRRLPAGSGANVIARVPARRRARRTLVLVAHHDAANTGLVWSPKLVAAGAARHLRRRRIDPFMAPLELALIMATSPGVVPRRSRLAGMARGVAAALLALGVAVDADIGRGQTVPGASDNATGVAVCLDLARVLAAQPLQDVDVLVVLPGSEEAGMGGMAAFLDAYGARLGPGRTFVLGLDTLGAGRPIVCSGEGAMREQRYREPDLRLVDEGAAMAGQPPPERWRIGGWTDPILAVHRGLPAVSLLSMGPGYLPHYHHPTDTPDHVDWDSVARCARIAGGIVQALARPSH